MAQLHKSFTDSQVKELMERYIKGEIKRIYIQQILGIKRRRFCELVKNYQQNPSAFSIQYTRTTKTRSISQDIEPNIIKELKIDKKMIDNKNIPLRRYNYSYIKTRLQDTYNQQVSLPTIIDRAKKNGFYLKNKPKKAVHDREVLTNYAGQLVQHDCSHHLFSPHAKQKWYLITSIDDFSRFMLYAMLLVKELAWTHILALQSVFIKYGVPISYYVDSHSIFRFVQGRDSIWRKHHKLTDESTPQWKQVIHDCNVEVIHALSPQAKGKVERPYQWIQDRLIRTCVRDNVSDISHAQSLLDEEVKRYNYRQIHSTTKEVPYSRFQKALKDKNSLFRPFSIKPPFLSPKDIFCLRVDRTIDSYRRISINNMLIKVNGSTPGDKVNLRIYPNENTGLSEVRFWSNNKLVDVQTLKNDDLNIVHF